MRTTGTGRDPLLVTTAGLSWYHQERRVGTIIAIFLWPPDSDDYPLNLKTFELTPLFLLRRRWPT